MILVVIVDNTVALKKTLETIAAATLQDKKTLSVLENVRKSFGL
jgi:hypothetical protein